MKKELILEKITNHLLVNGLDADNEDGIIHINYNSAVVMIEDEHVGLSFGLDTPVIDVAIITKIVMEACPRIEIYESYYEEFDENGDYVDMYWGDEAEEKYMDAREGFEPPTSGL